MMQHITAFLETESLPVVDQQTWKGNDHSSEECKMQLTHKEKGSSSYQLVSFELKKYWIQDLMTLKHCNVCDESP